MNSQCNGSFAQNQRADAGGNRRVLKNSLFSLSGFLGASPPIAPGRPRWPTLGELVSEAPFYDPGAYRNVRQTCVFRQKPKI